MLRICRLNLAYQPHPDLTSLLKCYPTLVGAAEALVAEGASVEVYQLFHREEVCVQGGVVYRGFTTRGLPHRLRWWHYPRPLLTSIHHHPPDVIHLSGLSFAGLIPHLRRVAPQSVIVVQDHGEKPRPPGLRLRVRSHLLRGADALFFHAAEAGELLRSRGQLGEVKIFEIPEASSELIPTSREVARQHLWLGEEKVVLWVGRLEEVKDPSTAFDAFCQLWRDDPAVRLYVIYQSSSLEAELRRRVEEAGATGAVKWLGRQNRAELALWMSAADTFVTTSPWEGSNYALIEALSCGLWPVASDIPTHRSLTRRGQFGHLFPPGDVGACTRVLAEALQVRGDISRRQELQRHFEENLSWGSIARQSLKVYGELTRGRGV